MLSRSSARGPSRNGRQTGNRIFFIRNPPQDAEGAVFRIQHGQHSAIWVNTRFDPSAGRVQYVYVLDSILTTKIDIEVTRENAARTAVKVSYERTALDPAANEHLKSMAEADAKAGPEWQAAIDQYVATLKK